MSKLLQGGLQPGSPPCLWRQHQQIVGITCIPASNQLEQGHQRGMLFLTLRIQTVVVLLLLLLQPSPRPWTSKHPPLLGMEAILGSDQPEQQHLRQALQLLMLTSLGHLQAALMLLLLH